VLPCGGLQRRHLAWKTYGPCLFSRGRADFLSFEPVAVPELTRSARLCCRSSRDPARGPHNPPRPRLSALGPTRSPPWRCRGWGGSRLPRINLLGFSSSAFAIFRLLPPNRMGNVCFHSSSIAEIERRARHDIAKASRYRAFRRTCGNAPLAIE